MFAIGAVLEVQEFFYKHVGVYVGNGMVLHNHRERGEEIVTLNQFSESRPVTIRHVGVSDSVGFMRRVRQILAKPGSYHFLLNNCEHTVYKVRDGIAVSPQLAALGIIAFVIGAGIVFARAS